MEDETRKANDPDAVSDPASPETTHSLKAQSSNTNKKTKRHTKQATKQGSNRKPSKKSFWKSFVRSWKASGPGKKLGMILTTLAAFGTVGYLFAYIVISILEERIIQNQHGPLVVHSRPPHFLQPVTCDPTRIGGGLTFGNAEHFVRNIGDETASAVFPYMIQMKVIPEQRTGNHFWDDLPVPDCNFVPGITPMMFSLVPREEKAVQERQGVLGIPPSVKKGDIVQLYMVECVYYSTSSGKNRATCDTYRFAVPSDNPLDRNFGTPSFPCDGTPRTGTFSESITGRCIK